MSRVAQVSFVLSQLKWFKVGDIDDCWVVSAIQAAHAVAPWLYLPSTTTFRAAADDPDDGKDDGGKLIEIEKGVEGVWPVFSGRLRRLRGVSWTDFLEYARVDQRPMSLAVISSDLPVKLQFGFQGYHQITALSMGNKVWVANPLAPPAYSRWVEVASWEVLRPAIMHYGRDKAGTNGAWAVAFPTAADMLPTHPLFAEVAAAQQPAIIAGAEKQGWNAAIEEAGDLATAGAAQIAALHRP